MKLFVVSMLIGTGMFVSVEGAWAATRYEKLNLCSLKSRTTIKEKYILNQPVSLNGLTTWLSGENASEDIYKYTLVAEIRDSSGTLYNWFFSTTAKFENEDCQLIQEEFSGSMPIRESDESSD